VHRLLTCFTEKGKAEEIMAIYITCMSIFGIKRGRQNEGLMLLFSRIHAIVCFETFQTLLLHFYSFFQADTNQLGQIDSNLQCTGQCLYLELVWKCFFDQ
jgi:hypothetical protein